MILGTEGCNAMLEHKFCQAETALEVIDGTMIAGYASLFGRRDKGGDTVQAGAYGASLSRLAESGIRVKMLWQHDPAQPIGVWDEVREDDTGLYVKGRLLPEVARAREACALVEAGAIDGLSIGYRTKRAEKDPSGARMLHELELWEVSLVTFPMLPEARVGAKEEAPAVVDDLAEILETARLEMSLTREECRLL